MRNNIASFEKTSSSEVKFWAKNAKINSALIFSIILTSLLLLSYFAKGCNFIDHDTLTYATILY